MAEQSPSFTREDDFDADFKYALWEDLELRVEAGELTQEQANQTFLERTA